MIHLCKIYSFRYNYHHQSFNSTQILSYIDYDLISSTRKTENGGGERERYTCDGNSYIETYIHIYRVQDRSIDRKRYR
jgi:hypothetical protein